MGLIGITVTGSFKKQAAVSFGAMDYGHAHAVAEAIAFLTNVVLPSAIDQDHRLQDEGHGPSKGFIKGES